MYQYRDVKEVETSNTDNEHQCIGRRVMCYEIDKSCKLLLEVCPFQRFRSKRLIIIEQALLRKLDTEQ